MARTRRPLRRVSKERFKTAKELGITPRQHEAMRWLLKCLQGGRKLPGEFNMNLLQVRATGCGTTACIAGWVDFRCKVEHTTTYNQRSILSRIDWRNGSTAVQLERLFYPCNFMRHVAGWDRLKHDRDLAATVLEHYMITGRGNWEEAIHAKGVRRNG